MRESYKTFTETVRNNEKENLNTPKNQKTKTLSTDREKNTRGIATLFVPRRLPSINRTANLDLAVLIDFQIKKCPKAEKETEGWFHCSVKDLEEIEKQYMYPARQSRVLKYLEAKGFIKRIVKGKPPTRSIWIDYDKIIQEIN